MKLILIATATIPVFSQFVGDGDDYDSVEYGDDDTQDGTLLGRLSGGQGQANRVGGRRRMINNMAVRNFAAFEGYGCWCLEKKGYGPVRDEIDFACMTHSKCWGCAKATNGDECDGVVTAYRWKFIKDKATNSAIDIKCVDSDPCKKSICECDRDLAINLRNMESVYEDGNRDESLKSEQCPKKEIDPSARALKTHEKLDSCCGDEIFKFPYASASGKRSCCGTRTYSTELLECCDQSASDIRAIGSCPSI